MLRKQFQTIEGLKMAYVDTGKGDPIVFLHGNPTSSYIWRNIIPYVQDQGRCIAPDLMGMGDSDKFPDSSDYTFEKNYEFLDQFFHQLGVHEHITFVAYDWGAALAFHWAKLHPGAVKGIVYMETIIKPRDWSEMPPVAQEVFKKMRSPEGETMVLQQNSMIEFNLVKTIQRTLSEEEMNEYRRPFLVPGEGRRAMLSWARQLPVGGEPANIVKMVEDYGKWLERSSDVPKLFIEAKPGLLSQQEREYCSGFPNQEHVAVKGLHNLQEDSPEEIGKAIAGWLKGVR